MLNFFLKNNVEQKDGLAFDYPQKTLQLQQIESGSQLKV
jgi:hypothetical protein